MMLKITTDKLPMKYDDKGGIVRRTTVRFYVRKSSFSLSCDKFCTALGKNEELSDCRKCK